MTTVAQGQPGLYERFQLASARVPFRAKLAVVWFFIAVILIGLFAKAGFDVGWMREKAWFVAQGLKYTILLAIAAIALACIMALIGSLCRLSSNPVLFGVSGFYTSFFRGTPLIVQLFLIYLALPQIGAGFGNPRLTDALTLSVFQAGVIGLGLNYGAYMTEIFRAGIQSVPHGQWEAAEALGMKYTQRMRRVILPQALRVIIPPTGNEFIAMLKDTALVGFLGVSQGSEEIFRRAQLVGKADFKNLEAYLLAALMYWALTALFTVFQARLERRLGKGYVRTSEARTVAVAAAGGQPGLAAPPAPLAVDADVVHDEGGAP